jgi:hypothetical protein
MPISWPAASESVLLRRMRSSKPPSTSRTSERSREAISARRRASRWW